MQADVVVGEGDDPAGRGRDAPVARDVEAGAILAHVVGAGRQGGLARASRVARGVVDDDDLVGRARLQRERGQAAREIVRPVAGADHDARPPPVRRPPVRLQRHARHGAGQDRGGDRVARERRQGRRNGAHVGLADGPVPVPEHHELAGHRRGVEGIPGDVDVPDRDRALGGAPAPSLPGPRSRVAHRPDPPGRDARASRDPSRRSRRRPAATRRSISPRLGRAGPAVVAMTPPGRGPSERRASLGLLAKILVVFQANCRPVPRPPRRVWPTRGRNAERRPASSACPCTGSPRPRPWPPWPIF